MRKHFGLNIASCLVLAIAAAGCSTSGGVDPSGQAYKDLQNHDYATARQEFATAYANAPHDPYVELDLGVAYQSLGRGDLAEPYYRGVIADGKGIVPESTTNPSDAGKPLDSIACENMRMSLNGTPSC